MFEWPSGTATARTLITLGRIVRSRTLQLGQRTAADKLASTQEDLMARRG